MRIIGHRGAAGLALENSLQAIRTAKQTGVDGVEFDVQLTADKQFVLCHDKALHRVSEETFEINTRPLSAIKRVRLHNGETVATLEEALAAAGSTPVFVEAKDAGWAEPLARVLRKHQTAPITVIALDQAELVTFHSLLPAIPVYLVQRFNPVDVFQALQAAQQCEFTGIVLNFWLLNPLTYWLARRYNLAVGVYTVNFRWIARFLHWLFPKIDITTNRPDLMQPLRTSRKAPAAGHFS